MSILCHPLGSCFPVGRIEISNKNFQNSGMHFVFFFPCFRAFFPVVVDLLALGCSLSLGSKSLGLDHLFILLGLDHLFISLGLEGWHLRLPCSFGGLGGAGFA